MNISLIKKIKSGRPKTAKRLSYHKFGNLFIQHQIKLKQVFKSTVLTLDSYPSEAVLYDQR